MSRLRSQCSEIRWLFDAALNCLKSAIKSIIILVKNVFLLCHCCALILIIHYLRIVDEAFQGPLYLMRSISDKRNPIFMP